MDNTTTISKPVSLARRELVDGIVNLINDSHLPMFIVLPIIQDVQRVVEAEERAEYIKDLEAWQKATAPTDDDSTQEEE